MSKEPVTAYEVRRAVETEELRKLFEKYGATWYTKLMTGVETGTLENLDFCDYATMLHNCFTEKEASRVENIIGTKLALDEGKVIPITDAEHTRLVEDFGAYIYSKLPALVRGVIDANKINLSTLSYYANTVESNQKYYQTVYRLVYQSYQMYDRLCTIDDVYNFNAVEEIKRLTTESPSFSGILIRKDRTVKHLSDVEDEEKLKEINDKYRKDISTIKSVVHYFFEGDITQAATVMVNSGIDLSLSKFMA